MKAGDPVTVKLTLGSELFGRVLSTNESGSIVSMVTPGGSVFRSGLAWCRRATAADLAELRRYESLATQRYGGKLDHVLGYTEAASTSSS